MAISDILSDAVYEMRCYLASQPSMYAEVRPRIDALLTEMEAVRVELDRPPYDDPTGPHASVLEALENDPTGPNASASAALESDV